MITIAQEERIRAMIASGDCDYRIAREVGVHRDSVAAVRTALSALDQTTEEQRHAIYTMLAGGLPIGAIEMRLRVPATLVRAVRRYFYIQRRLGPGDGPAPCPTCGSMMFPQADRQERHLRRYVVPPERIAAKDVAALYRIACEVEELHRLSGITHPLFHDLATRTTETLKRIRHEKQQDAHAA